MALNYTTSLQPAEKHCKFWNGKLHQHNEPIPYNKYILCLKKVKATTASENMVWQYYYWIHTKEFQNVNYGMHAKQLDMGSNTYPTGQTTVEREPCKGRKAMHHGSGEVPIDGCGLDSCG